MKRVATLVFSAAMLAALASSAFAALRVPQIAVQGGTLQGYLNGQGESINVLTDQNAVQSWSTTVSNNSTFSLQIELAGNAASNSIGIYNAAAPAPAVRHRARRSAAGPAAGLPHWAVRRLGQRPAARAGAGLHGHRGAAPGRA